MGMNRSRVATTAATVSAAAGIMTVGLLLVPQVGANADRSAMSETGRMSELPVHPVVRHGALAYAPGGA